MTPLPPERINTPLDELMRDVHRSAATYASDNHHDDDGPITLSEATHLSASSASDHTETRK
jgi:hypothetical protein